jgi:hypothetical protein
VKFGVVGLDRNDINIVMKQRAVPNDDARTCVFQQVNAVAQPSRLKCSEIAPQHERCQDTPSVFTMSVGNRDKTQTFRRHMPRALLGVDNN